MKWKIQSLALLLTTCAAWPAQAVPLYQQRMEQAVPDREALEHSADLLQKHRDLEIRDKPVIQPFHKQSGELETAPATFCRDCHGPLPHSKQLRTRAFMNIHVRFIACETCHFRPEDAKLDYFWFDYQTASTVDGAGLFRLGKDLDNEKQRPDNPKIVPFYQGQPVIVLKDGDFSRNIATQWQNATSQQKIPLRAKIHWPLEKKGPECQACHSGEQPLLDLPALGATAEQTRAMQKHVIPQFFGRYQKDDQRITIRDMLR